MQLYSALAAREGDGYLFVYVVHVRCWPFNWDVWPSSTSSSGNELSGKHAWRLFWNFRNGARLATSSALNTDANVCWRKAVWRSRNHQAPAAGLLWVPLLLLRITMKVTVAFGSTGVVVPCKEGWTVRDLIQQATQRYRKLLEQTYAMKLRNARCSGSELPAKAADIIENPGVVPARKLLAWLTSETKTNDESAVQRWTIVIGSIKINIMVYEAGNDECDFLVRTHHVEYCDGGILDPDDVLTDLVEDKDKSERLLINPVWDKE
ncbi:hypothetical protein DNTS_021368 [Danionella cerebrum]|uniref:Par3/HAL N-terminal domain-containing protein n=1 Tax=Danionella cerebrum TaxID=2873325 RepID=A0A553N086_9TELE|nr:hypothetical protein DNTS_021368 [Danionella translucida]